jgi:hypothetical protein
MNRKEELPTYAVQLNAFEIGILVGALSANQIKVSERIWKVTEQFNEEAKDVK